MSFQMDRQKMYTMPIQFGPCLGPRQNSEGCTRASADSWGFRFLELEFQWDRGTPAQKELQALMYDPARQGDMNYKYIPQTGDGFTGCDVEYMTLTPKVTSYPEDVQTFPPPPEPVYGSGTIVWHRPCWEDMPTQFRIVQGLESLPIKRFLGAYRTTAQSLNDSFDQRILR